MLVNPHGWNVFDSLQLGPCSSGVCAWAPMTYGLASGSRLAVCLRAYMARLQDKAAKEKYTGKSGQVGTSAVFVVILLTDQRLYRMLPPIVSPDLASSHSYPDASCQPMRNPTFLAMPMCFRIMPANAATCTRHGHALASFDSGLVSAPWSD